MSITYKTNGSSTTESLTEWYFGTKFVQSCTDSALRMHEKSGEREFKFWQSGTGYMTVVIS